MKAVNPKNNTKDGIEVSERTRLLREFFLNASLLAVMKEAVVEAVELENLEREVSRAEERAISAPAA